MSKKLRIKLVAGILLVALILTGKVDSLTLTQKVGNELMKTTVEENQEVRMIFTSKDGFRFKNWVVEEGNISIELNSSDVTFTMPNEDVTIKAKYDSQYEITFHSNDGTERTASMTVIAGRTEPLISNPFTRDGYRFQGWSTEPNGAVQYLDEGDCEPQTNLSLYALWQLAEVTVIFSSDGAEVGRAEVIYGETYTNLPMLTKTGYTLDGWYKENGTNVTNGTEVTEMATHTLYARWTANTYTVKYNANGGSGSMADSSYTYGIAQALRENAFTKTNYTFVGWATSANGDKVYDDKQSVSNLTATSNGTVNLYAKWKAVWNEPVLSTGMKAVNYSGSTWTVLDNTSNWDYNYIIATAGTTTVEGDGTAKWANAVIDGDGDGTYESYYVWIPRFTYKVTTGNKVSWNSDKTGTKTAKTQIKFSDGVNDYTTGDYSGYSKHSAFTLKDKNGNVVKELTGFWVAKFEASKGSNNKPLSKAGVQSWRGQNASDNFSYSKNLNSNIGSHMLKDSEWGAVAYLTNAIGRIPYINDSENYYTGNSSGTQDGVGYAVPNITNSYDSINGVKASTTHNIYGVYDMSGGAYEDVASYYSEYNSVFSQDLLNLVQSYNEYGTVYVDVYSTTSPTGDCARLGWDADQNEGFSSGATPSRGAQCAWSSGAGIFAYSYGGISGSTISSFRVALWGFAL